MVGVAVLVEGGLGLIALAVGWLLGTAPLAQIAYSSVAVGYGLLATVPMLVALWAMTRWPVGPLKVLGDMVDEMLVPLFRGCTFVELLLISAAAGLGEELLFRGVAQTAIERFTDSPWAAILLASALFGLAHPISTTYVVLAGLIGVYLGWLLVATENLLVPIIAHAAYDFCALVYLLRGADQPAEAESPELSRDD